MLFEAGDGNSVEPHVPVHRLVAFARLVTLSTIPLTVTSCVAPCVRPVSESVADGVAVLMNPRARATCVKSMAVMSYSPVVTLNTVVPLLIDRSSIVSFTSTLIAVVGCAAGGVYTVASEASCTVMPCSAAL